MKYLNTYIFYLKCTYEFIKYLKENIIYYYKTLECHYTENFKNRKITHNFIRILFLLSCLSIYLHIVCSAPI